MPWRLIEVDEDDAIDSDLTDGELVGVSIVLAHNCEKGDVYRRAWQKIQPQVSTAIEND